MPNDNEDDKTDPNLVIPPPAPLGVKMPKMGPLADLMKDPHITEIMINDVRNIMIERDGKIFSSGLVFQSGEELNRLTKNILESAGRTLDSDTPYVDLMLADGSRVNIIGSPLTLQGPCITIRKFPTRRFSIDDLVQMEMLDSRMAAFLKGCIAGKINILVAGGTNSGKTTLLNALTQQIPKDERIVVIEDTPELMVNQVNSVRLQVKPQTPISPPITARELVANSLRMRPDRIIVGECRRGEAFDMLQAMNTGHGGSMTTLHANSPRDGLARLETLCLLAEVDLPLAAIRRQINSAIDLVVQVKRFRDGKRRIVSIIELTGMEVEIYTLQDLFLYEIDPGNFKCTGYVPTFLNRLADEGVEFPKNFFA